VTRIVAYLGLALLAGCGFDWFPSNNTFVNTSTAKSAAVLQNHSSARQEPLGADNYSTAGRAELFATPPR